MKKLYFVAFFSILLLAAFCLTAFGIEYDPATEDVDVLYLESLDNNEVICEKNADKRVAPASITKIVTAIIAIENCENLNLQIKVPAACINILDGTNSSTVDLKAGETMTIRHLLYCMLVSSANDAANVIANYVGNGDIDAFVGMMNQFVANLGCTDTHFTNAHGLDDPDHYTTARDLSRIYQFCLKNSLFSQINETLDYEVPETNKSKKRDLHNTNGLINPGIADYYYEYAKGGKTGTTDDAGRCLISWASKDGYNYMCVAMNGKFYDYDNDGVEENMAFVESKRAYDWVFNNIRLREVANPDIYVCEIKVRLASKTDRLRLAPAKSVSVLVPVDVDASSVYIDPYPDQTKEQVEAPVKKGDVLGRAAVKYAGETIADVDLVAMSDVNPSVIKYVGHMIGKTFTSPGFLICAVLVILLAFPAMVYLFAFYPLTHRKNKNAIRMVSLKGAAQQRRNSGGKTSAVRKQLSFGSKVARPSSSAKKRTAPPASRSARPATSSSASTAAKPQVSSGRHSDDPFDIGWMPEGMENIAAPKITSNAIGGSGEHLSLNEIKVTTHTPRKGGSDGKAAKVSSRSTSSAADKNAHKQPEPSRAKETARPAQNAKTEANAAKQHTSAPAATGTTEAARPTSAAVKETTAKTSHSLSSSKTTTIARTPSSGKREKK